MKRFSSTFLPAKATSKAMNHRDALGSGGHRGSRGRFSVSGLLVYRPELENPVTVDRSLELDESSGSSGRGLLGRGRCSALPSLRNTSLYANAEHSPEQPYLPTKSSQVSKLGFVEMRSHQDKKSVEHRIGCTKKPDEIASLKFSGEKIDLLHSSLLPSSKNINRGGGLFFSNDKDLKLVKQMRDVDLYCTESVYSTSDDQRVEFSSFLCHDHVQKSGDGGNYSNKINMRPFDLFLEKKAMGLKPSLLEPNKQRKNTTKGSTGIVIRPGIVLLKNYLSINDQVMIVKKCRGLGLGEGGFYQPGYGDGASLHLKMMCLGKNWEFGTCRYGETRPFDGSTPPKIPSEFNQLVEKAIKESQSLAAEEFDIIPNMLPDICIVNFYESNSRNYSMYLERFYNLEHLQNVGS